MSSGDIYRDEVADGSVVCDSLSKLSVDGECDQPVKFDTSCTVVTVMDENRDFGAKTNSTASVNDSNHSHRKLSCSDRALLRTCRSLEFLCYNNESVSYSLNNISISMPTFSLQSNTRSMIGQQISSPTASLMTEFPTLVTTNIHENPFKLTQNHGASTKDPSPSGSKTASVISKQNSYEDVISHHSSSDDDDASDDCLLPGSRRRRLAASDDSDNSDSDDNVLFDEAKSDRQMMKRGSDELVHANSSPEHTDSYLVVSDSPEATPIADHPTPDEEVPPVELDADQDKTNPAYVPRTGTYFMHDYRDLEKDASNGNTSKGRADQHKWTHDRFRYHDQAPRSSRELIRKYGYDIRNGPYDQQPNDVRKPDDRKSELAAGAPSGQLDHMEPSKSIVRNDSSSDQLTEPRTNSRHPKRSGKPVTTTSKIHYPEQNYTKFRRGRGRFTTSSNLRAYMDFSNESRRTNVIAIPRNACHQPTSDCRECGDWDTLENTQNKPFSRKSDSSTEKKVFETQAESKPMRYSALRQNVPRVIPSNTEDDRRKVLLSNASDGHQNPHISYSAHLGLSQRHVTSFGRNSRKTNISEKISSFRSEQVDADALEADDFPEKGRGRRQRYDTQPRQTHPGRRPGFGRRPLKPLEPRNPYPRDSVGLPAI